MRILYGVVGEGMGHATRSRVVIEHLLARGPIIDLPALARALQDETIAGAALDVVDPEPLPADSPFYRMSNVILTPHSAYYSERSVDVVRRETLLEALQVLRGKRPRTVANPAVLDKVTLEP